MWRRKAEKLEATRRRNARLNKLDWREDWEMRHERLERERSMYYTDNIIPFEEMIKIYILSKEKFSEVADFGFCGFVGEYVLGRANEQNNCEIVEVEDLSDVPENLEEYTNGLLEQIWTILNDVGVVGIHLNNQAQLEHYFVLFNTDQGVFRLEAYSRVYIPRINQWDTWERDLYELLTMTPSYGLNMYWSGLFNVHLLEKEKPELYLRLR